MRLLVPTGTEKVQTVQQSGAIADEVATFLAQQPALLSLIRRLMRSSSAKRAEVIERVLAMMD